MNHVTAPRDWATAGCQAEGLLSGALKEGKRKPVCRRKVNRLALAQE